MRSVLGLLGMTYRHAVFLRASARYDVRLYLCVRACAVHIVLLSRLMVVWLVASVDCECGVGLVRVLACSVVF